MAKATRDSGSATVETSLGKEEPKTKEAILSPVEDFYTIPSSPEDAVKTSVNVKYGLTINLGNYSTGRIDVGISMPCDPENKKIEKCYEWIKQFTQEAVREETDALYERHKRALQK